MSVQHNGARATPVMPELAPRDGAGRGRPVIRLPSDDQRRDPVLDELAEELSNRLVDRLAERLVRELADLAKRDHSGSDEAPPIPDGATYATSEQLAARYQLSVQWVESRAANLGATPISDSTNSKLRYHLATADAYMDGRRRGPPTRTRSAGGRKPKPRKRTHTRTGRPLLDVE